VERNKIIVRLKGGLGNQMFQYAAARSIAERNQMKLLLDARSGFQTDKVYRRNFSLDYFNIPESKAKLSGQIPFYFEDIIDKYVDNNIPLSEKDRPWGICLKENVIGLHEAIFKKRTDCNLWLDGFWQSESYFKDISSDIANAFKLSSPSEEIFLTLADRLKQENAIAIGLRLYEEAPEGSHNPPPLYLIQQAAEEILKEVDSATFYLFCTRRHLIEGKLSLPGKVQYVTSDDGYGEMFSTLWLLSQFQYHIISHSSFYWWGAWLAERNKSNVKVYAHNFFEHMIPQRWYNLGN
jgi:hypothetical protein